MLGFIRWWMSFYAADTQDIDTEGSDLLRENINNSLLVWFDVRISLRYVYHGFVSR